ncbi:serine/threonine-protein kinase ZRK1 [Citrus sinensis]|uniref:Serine/threonine-protein kinase ZRK1 n=1 Tax=Citrus sinensis TaxID=2711 RepID=A0ACB8HWR5_CITSI|nr:serine/threonine-protein kinase ZRK1 [Citrus sinensis]
MNCLLRKIKRSEREKTKIYVMRNGEMFLEKLIKSCNNKRNPLLFDFSFSVSIPEGETHITDWLLGTFGYIAPEYVTNGDCNEKCDVYSFGMLLLELLTGQRAVDRSRRQEIEDEYFLGDHVRLYIERSRFNEIIDAVIVGDGLCSATEQKVRAFTKLAFSCLSVSAEDRPTMVDVARKLRLMYCSET